MAWAVSIFCRLSAKALAPVLVAKPPVLVMAKAGKVAVGVGCQHHRQHGYSWRAPVAGPSSSNVIGLVRFAFWFLSPSVWLVQGIRERACSVECQGRPWW